MQQFGAAARSEWMIDPSVTYLNHGTVGAPPRRVLAAQQALRDEIERQPAQFQLREIADPHATGSPAHPRLRAAANSVGEFLGVPGEHLAFVDNATTGANAVLRSFRFREGDEVLVTELGYGGVTNAAQWAVEWAGGTIRTAPMPAPGAPAESFVDAIVAAIGPHTRIVVVDHITAETALVLPVAEIAAACHAKGAQVLVDGAHVPGAIELDIDALGVDWYTANLHKWCWTPRSSGVLWASDEWRPSLRPTTISWGLGNGLGAEFDLLGTRDPTAFLAAPEAIAMMREWGVERVRGWNHGLAWQAGQLLSHRWGTRFDTPEEMVGTMVNVALPDASGSTDADAGAMRTHLWDAHRIEVPVFAHGGHLTLRVSAQVYNDLAQIELLADAVSAAGSRAAAS